MRTLFCISITLIILWATNNLYAQKDLSNYSYKEIDSIVGHFYQKGDFNNCILFSNIAKEKAAKEFGIKDTTYASHTGNLGYFYYEAGQYRKASLFLKESVYIMAETFGKKHKSYGEPLNNLALCYFSMGDYDKALGLFLEVQEIYRKTIGETHEGYALTLNNIASTYLSLGDFELAEKLFMETKEIYEKTVGKEHPNYAQSLNNLASLYQEMQRYEEAEPLLLEVVKIYADYYSSSHPSYAYAINQLAFLYKRMDLFEKAEKLYLEAIATQKKILGENHPNYALTLNNLSVMYQENGRVEEAAEILAKANKIRAKVFGKDHFSYAQGLVNLAGIKERMGKSAEAEKLYYEALSIYEKQHSKENLSCALVMINLAKLYHKNKNSEKAWDCLQLSINYTCEQDMSGEINIAWADKIKAIELPSYKYSFRLFTALRSMFHILATEETAVNKKKQSIIADLVLELLEESKNNFEGENDKLKILSLSSAWVLSSLSILDKNTAVDKAFSIAEQNKSVLLMDAAKTEKAYSFGALPDSLVELEKELQKNYATTKAGIAEKRSEEEKSKLQAELIELNKEISIFKTNVKATYPKYYDLKYESKKTTVAAIQSQLDEKTALIEYVIGESLVYIFYLDKKTAKLYEVKIPSDTLKQKIKLLHNTLSDYHLILSDTVASRKNYLETAPWFYKKLLQPVLHKKEYIKSLLIIPDGELSHLPFESFLVEMPLQKDRYSDFHYLLKDYKISYHYSATLWKENLENGNKKNNGLLFAMAPNYEVDPTASDAHLRAPSQKSLRAALQALPAARKELEALEKSFRGFFGYDNNATERIFKEKAGDYAIIHLAMHGLLDEKNPILSSMAFTENGDSLENNFLQAYEISKMELNADLVVLSACETGFGKFEKGNGTASLARAFMYAGVPALVVSLWQVNDASTSLIMQSFYKNLAKGMDKAAALQQAKLAYVETIHESSQQGSIAAHPAFWSPFILIGDSAPIHIAGKSGGWWFWAAIGSATLLLLAGGGLLALRRFKNKK